MENESKMLGIIGGMGAKAGAVFYERLVDMTPASRDQDHIETILYSNPGIPDRTEGILGVGPDPYPALLESVKLLTGAGADIIVIACVSAHYYVPWLRKETEAKILSAIEETVGVIAEGIPDMKKVGILGTTGTIRSELFQNALEGKGYESVVLPEDEQETLVMEGIYGVEGIKAGKLEDAKRRIMTASEKLVEMGAESLIVACSELPLVLSEDDCRIPLFDSMEILIRKAVSICIDS